MIHDKLVCLGKSSNCPVSKQADWAIPGVIMFVYVKFCLVSILVIFVLYRFMLILVLISKCHVRKDVGRSCSRES